MMHKVFVFCLLCLAFTLHAAPNRDARKSGAAKTVVFTDSAGRPVEVPAVITRAAPSGSLAQMFLLAVAPELLCAVSGPYTADQAAFIPEYVKTLPVLGQFYGSRDLNPEVAAGIAPDIVIDVGEPKDSIAEDMDGISRAIAVPAVHITATLRSAPEAFRSLGRLLGREAKGEALARFCERALAESEAAMRGAARRPSILYCLGPSGTNVLAAGSFHAEVLDWLAVNAAVVDNPSSRSSGSETDMEQILLWDPDVILFAPDSVYAAAGSDRLWSELRAVREGDYFRVPLGPYNWMGAPPSINRYLGMLWLGTLLYDAEYDLYTETAEYYRLFYGFDLSREQFNALTAGSLR
ncbi:MAG: ABC transporter substrate-binding protein [Treponema sp.]|jgi:iron complex transport system substrate-binding protein|nr:ABC transporter substrate-binding protein [Treponema sp.]